MAVVAAAMRGRYESMVTAMEQASLEPVIIEDLVKFGEDRGYERGRLEGEEQGRLEEERATLRRVLALRKLGLKAEGEARIDACTDLATLQRWLDQAVFAASADEALQ
jgi:predicted transposase YdaD